MGMNVRRRFVTVDVFTDTRFQGNPVAVVLDAAGLRPEQMQSLAAEFGYVETTFVLPPSDERHDAHVRIFTPDREIGFAGHPNIGTAFAIAYDRLAAGGSVGPSLAFEEAAGLVTVEFLREGDRIAGGDLLAPQPLQRLAHVDPEAAAACLSLKVSDLRLDRHCPQVASVGLPFLFVELRARDALQRARPDRSAYDRLFPLDGARAVYAYTRADSVDQNAGRSRVNARMFTWRLVEDPATGSAASALTALLASFDGRPVSLEIRQGEDMGRSSLLQTRSVMKDGSIRAHVGGRCVPVFEGSFVL